MNRLLNKYTTNCIVGCFFGDLAHASATALTFARGTLGKNESNRIKYGLIQSVGALFFSWFHYQRQINRSSVYSKHIYCVSSGFEENGFGLNIGIKCFIPSSFVLSIWLIDLELITAAACLLCTATKKKVMVRCQLSNCRKVYGMENMFMH